MGPLEGLRVVELAGIGPGPFACMLLADLGADVLRIERLDAPPADPHDVLLRGRPYGRMTGRGQHGPVPPINLIWPLVCQQI